MFCFLSCVFKKISKLLFLKSQKVLVEIVETGGGGEHLVSVPPSHIFRVKLQIRSRILLGCLNYKKKMLENSSVLIEIQHVKPTSLKRNKSLFLVFLGQ